MEEQRYSFTSREDAALYIRQVGMLWLGWVIGLSGLLLTNAWMLITWGVTTVVVLMLLARPLQRRAENLVPKNEVVGGKLETTFRGGTARDRALRDLAYGTEPLRVALDTVGRSEHWVMVRHLIVALTIFGLVYVIMNPGV